MIGKLKLYLALAGGFVVALVTAYLRGRKDQNSIDHERELNEYVETRRRMDENTIPADADAAHEWLRKRSEQRGDL